MTNCLDGIWVVDMTTMWAGPFASLILADFGANVIKLESVRRPDPTRLLHVDKKTEDEKKWNHSGYFHQFHRNKYDLTLDLSNPEGYEIFLKLISKCDIFIENFASRVIRQLRITYEDLVKIKSDIIMLSLHGFGSSGPYQDMPAYGGSIEATTGFRSVIGYGDGIPVAPGTPLADPLSSLHGIFAVLSALAYRRDTGKGQFIDLSLHESMGAVFEEAILECTINKKEPQQFSDHHPFLAPYGFYKCKGEDSWVAITVSSDEEWLALCRAIDCPEIWEDRFSDPLNRLQNQKDLDRLIEKWTVQQDRIQVMNILQKAGIPAGACYDSEDLINDPHHSERAYFWSIKDVYPQVGPAINLSRSPATLRMRPPFFGEHNDFILKELLNLPDSYLVQLREKKVIGEIPDY